MKALVRDPRQHEFRAGQRGGAQHEMDLASEASARDEDQALGEGRVLVGELHGHPAAERMPDHRGAAVSQRDQYVAHAGSVSAQRVVAARLGRLAVAEQIRGHDGVVLGQDPRHGIPLSGATGDPVN